MFKSSNPAFKQLISEKLEGQHFMRHIGFELSVIEEGNIEGRMPVKKIHQQQNGFIHGGVISSLADIVAGFAAFTLVPPDIHVVTAEIKINYFLPGMGEEIIARGWVVKPGSRFYFCESEVIIVNGPEETQIAKASATMALVDAFKPDND